MNIVYKAGTKLVVGLCRCFGNNSFILFSFGRLWNNKFCIYNGCE